MVWKGRTVLLANEEGSSTTPSGAARTVLSEGDRERMREELQRIASLLTSGEITQEWKGFKQLMRLKDELIMLFAAASRPEEPGKTIGGSDPSGP
jgi:hypothetical protein